MRQAQIILALALLAGCGKDIENSTGPCSHSTNGIWNSNINGDVLTLNADCSGTGTACNTTFDFTAPAADGQTTVTIKTFTAYSGCLPPGTYYCYYTKPSPISLYVNCGVNGNWTYYK